MKILITGGAGFIGTRLSALLLGRGAQVSVLDNLHPQVHTADGLPKRLPPEVEFIPGDVTAASCFETLFRYRKPEVVIHLAAETGTGQSLTEAGRHAMVNVAGTANLLDGLARAGLAPRKLILASSRAVYGDGAWRDQGGTVFYPQGRTAADLARGTWDPIGPSGSKATPLPATAGATREAPISVYGATKLAQEHVLAAWARAFGSGLEVLRLQNVYGPGQAVGNPYTGVLTLFAKLVREKQPIEVYEDGAIIRDFVHVADVCDALARAALSAPSGVRTLDIGSGEATTILAVAQTMASLTGAPPPRVSGRYRNGDVRAASCSIEAAARVLGYGPRWTLEKGLKDLLDGIALDTRGEA
jgi:dTDP-L-rhamnose 4-epimerase